MLRFLLNWTSPVNSTAADDEEGSSIGASSLTPSHGSWLAPESTHGSLLCSAYGAADAVGAACQLARLGEAAVENYVYHLGKKSGWCS